LKLAERYTHLTDKVLKELNRGLAKKRKLHDSHGFCKLIGELNRVYTRRSRILREILRRLPFFLAAVIVKHHSRILKIEELNVDPTGTKGALAKAIYTMPDNSFIYEKAVWLASSELGYDVNLEQVKPFHTSRLHNVCAGVLDRNSDHYDYAYCNNCGLKVNTHFNAALNISAKHGRPLSSRSFPPLNAREGNHSNDD
jgi:transposase